MSNFHISIPISGLIKREDYKYDITGLGGNWPSIATPSSGLFTATGKTATINTTISFMPTTGSLHNNILPYSLLSCGYEDSELFTRVSARATLLSDNSTVSSAVHLVRCSGCLPKISVSLSGCGSEICGQHTLTNTNIFDFISSFSGLEPNTSYKYSIKSIGSNWPVIMISPTGGSFTANSSIYSLKHKLAFCPYSGNLCGSSNVLDHNLTQCFNKNNLYSNIELSISPEYCSNEKVFSNNILLNCKNCLPKVFSSLVDKISTKSSNIVMINGSFSGLVPNTRYNYSFNTIDSNWPSILKPISGSFIANSITENISSQLMFCSPSGNCGAGTVGLLPYTLDNPAEKDFNQKKLHTNLVLNLTSECGDNVNSKECYIECDDCLPCVRHANALFDSGPIIALDGNCCVGQKLIKVNVSNAVPGDKYSYSFSAVSGLGVNSILFNPSTGEIYCGSDGIGSVNTICDINLVDNAQTILTFSLLHHNTNYRVIDNVALSCNKGC